MSIAATATPPIAYPFQPAYMPYGYPPEAYQIVEPQYTTTKAETKSSHSDSGDRSSENLKVPTKTVVKTPAPAAPPESSESEEFGDSDD